MDNREIWSNAINKAMVSGYNTRTLTSKQLYYCRKEIMFNHLFAKAFWGEELLDIGYKDFAENECKYIRQYHLQQMVLEEEPLKYLEKFL